MGVVGALAARSDAAYTVAQMTIAGMSAPLSAREKYDKLESYYYNRQTFSDVMAMIASRMGDNAPKTARSLKTPAYRVVEFHAAHLWPGQDLTEAFQFQNASAALQAAIRQVWDWSNFGARRNVIARRFAMLGDVFILVAQSSDRKRVFFRSIDPRYVTNHLFDDQDRGFLVYIRTDIPSVTVNENEEETTTWDTAIWDKARNSYRLWQGHGKGAGSKIQALGTPTLEGSITGLFRIDFIPIVHAPFKDDGAGLGLGAYELQIGKIDEANSMATELHAKLFRHNQPTRVVMAKAVDGTGAPMPAPRIPGFEGYMRTPANPGVTYGTNGTSHGDGAASSVSITQVGDEQWIYLDGNAEIEDLIPKINYEDALKILVDYMGELEDDMPEMAYSRIRELPGDASGVALRYRLMGAIDRALEARANIMPALVRLNQMAVTIGRNVGLFQDIQGEYESGALDHSFKLQPVIPESEMERLEADSSRASVAVVKDQAGWPRRQIFVEAGYTVPEATAMITARNAQNEEAVDLAQRAFDRGDDLGDGSGGNPSSGEGTGDGES